MSSSRVFSLKQDETFYFNGVTFDEFMQISLGLAIK